MAGAVTDNVPPAGTWQLPATQAAPAVVEVGVIFVLDADPSTVTATVTLIRLVPLSTHTSAPVVQENAAVWQGLLVEGHAVPLRQEKHTPLVSQKFPPSVVHGIPGGLFVVSLHIGVPVEHERLLFLQPWIV
jgi:hypothetical protein